MYDCFILLLCFVWILSIYHDEFNFHELSYYLKIYMGLIINEGIHCIECTIKFLFIKVWLVRLFFKIFFLFIYSKANIWDFINNLSSFLHILSIYICVKCSLPWGSLDISTAAAIWCMSYYHNICLLLFWHFLKKTIKTDGISTIPAGFWAFSEPVRYFQVLSRCLLKQIKVFL